MVQVRKFKVVLPWGNDNNNTSENTIELPLELKIDEKFAVSITQNNLNEITVIINSGEKSNNYNIWCIICIK